jgi:tryptophanase
MSAKKDAMTNIGGFIATDDEELFRRCQQKCVLYEGSIPTAAWRAATSRR